MIPVEVTITKAAKDNVVEDAAQYFQRAHPADFTVAGV
jgi:hypothetical protein